MKKNELVNEEESDGDIEIAKAVAQAWHSHSSSTRQTNEFNAYKKANFKTRPSRFKIEASKKLLSSTKEKWDFSQSLLDSYELVAVSKRLETDLVFDHTLLDFDENNVVVANVNNKSKISSNKRVKIVLEICLIDSLLGDMRNQPLFKMAIDHFDSFPYSNK